MSWLERGRSLEGASSRGLPSWPHYAQLGSRPAAERLRSEEASGLRWSARRGVPRGGTHPRGAHPPGRTRLTGEREREVASARRSSAIGARPHPPGMMGPDGRVGLEEIGRAGTAQDALGRAIFLSGVLWLLRETTDVVRGARGVLNGCPQAADMARGEGMPGGPAEGEGDGRAEGGVSNGLFTHVTH